MEKTINWGILGCGKIATKFASDLLLLNNTRLLGVASRDAAKAAAFAATYGASHSYASYEELLNNPDLDVVYVATPHGLHYEHVITCLQHGKSVLCEKAFALNSAQVREMIALAKEKKLFLMEAMWSKFTPSYNTLMQQVQEKKLGDIKSVLVNFGFIPQPPIADRIFDPALGGGTLLDIGIYNVFYALSILGKPDSIEADMVPASTGVDEQCAILFKYNNGAYAQLFSSFSTHLPTEAFINGSEGRIKINSRFYTPHAKLEYYPQFMDSGVELPLPELKGWGYHYEAQHVNECLRQELIESPVMRHQDSLLLMETLDAIREKWKKA